MTVLGKDTLVMGLSFVAADTVRLGAMVEKAIVAAMNSKDIFFIILFIIFLLFLSCCGLLCLKIMEELFFLFVESFHW